MLGQMSKGQWPPNLLRLLVFRFVGGLLLLLLELFGPGRHHAIYARVGDGLAEVFAEVPGDGDERTAEGGRAVNIFCGLSASASLSATMAVRKCAKESFKACNTFGLSAESAAMALKSKPAGGAVPSARATP